MILAARMWIGSLVGLKKKKKNNKRRKIKKILKKSAPAFQVCEIIQGAVGEWGQGTGTPQQAILLSDAGIFCDCNARKRPQSLSQLDRLGLPRTVLRFEADFSEDLLWCDASGILNAVCTTDSSLINQWDVNVTVRISAPSVSQTQGERKGKFWCM